MKNHLPIIFIALLNFFLFVGKLIIGVFTNSVALLSDAVNSLSDTVNSTVVLYATYVAHLEADETHPAGHKRAQPLAAFFVAVMTAVLAFEIMKESIFKIFSPEEIVERGYAFGMIFLTIAVKGGLSIFEYIQGKKQKNSALLAMSAESKGDVFIALGVIAGVFISSQFHILWADPLIGFCIGIYILFTAYEIAKENIDFLMGASGSREQIKEVVKIIHSFKEVKSFHDLRTQHLGESLQVTVHCDVVGDFTLQEWHDLESSIAEKIESLEFVERAFVHMDPHNNDQLSMTNDQ